MVLLVFAGSAAEFALNRAVDWLFFTGKLPSDPIGRLFATASYAQRIVFADEMTATRTLDGIREAHAAIERQRGQPIPDWAHRDVLYMLIDYSERAHELLARPLSTEQQRELYGVFYRVGTGLRIPDLPTSYTEWRVDREHHLRRDLIHSEGTRALYAQYRRHLGAWRYHLLLRIQALLAPAHVLGLLGLTSAKWLRPLLRTYPILVRAGLRTTMQRLLMPSEYLAAVRGLDQFADGFRSSNGTDSDMTRHLWTLVNGIMLLLFVLSAAVQFNDPDPLAWMCIYGAAAVVCGLEIRRKTPLWLPVSLAIIAVVWAASLFSRARDVPIASLFAEWEMRDINVEEAREMYGLSIIAVWMIAIIVARRSSRRSRGSAP